MKLFLLKTAKAMIERRALPKIEFFVDIVLSYDNQEFRRNFRLSRGTYSFQHIRKHNYFITFDISQSFVQIIIFFT